MCLMALHEDISLESYHGRDPAILQPALQRQIQHLQVQEVKLQCPVCNQATASHVELPGHHKGNTFLAHNVPQTSL